MEVREHGYTVRDYPAFFRDIGFPRGLAMMEGVRGLVSLAHPGVTTVCVASRGVPTPSKLVYSQVGTQVFWINVMKILTGQLIP